MTLPPALIALVMLAGAPSAANVIAPVPAAVACTPIALDTLKQQASQLVTGKATAVKDDGTGGKLLTVKVAKSWKGTAVGADLTVRQDPDAAGEAGAKTLDLKPGTSYFVAASLPAAGQKIPALMEACGSSNLETTASGIIWELENGPIESAARVAVLDLLPNPDADVRLRAIARLSEFKDNDAAVYQVLRERALKDTDATVRVAAGRQVARGALAGKVEFKVAIAMLAVNDADVGPEICHAFLESAETKSKFKRKAISALQKVIVNKKEKQVDSKKKKKAEAWNAKKALACLEGHEGPDAEKDYGDYDGAWGK